MVKVLKLSEMDEKVQAFFNGIVSAEDSYLIESDGKTVMGLIPPQEIERKKRFDVFQRVWARNGSIDEKEVEQLIEQAVTEVRTQE